MSRNFNEYYHTELAKEMTHSKTAGVRTARAHMEQAFEAAYQVLRKFDSCKIKFEDSPTDVSICIFDPNEIFWRLDASSTPEWENWGVKEPSKKEMDEFKKGFISTFAKEGFEITLSDSNEATISVKNL